MRPVLSDLMQLCQTLHKRSICDPYCPNSLCCTYSWTSRKLKITYNSCKIEIQHSNPALNLSQSVLQVGERNVLGSISHPLNTICN